MSKIYIGTSGWQYKHWRGNFYPESLPQKDWLRYYSKQFDSVEVNSSFYRQTKTSTFKKWLEETPKNFVFSIKGNRFITHIKRLKDCKEPIRVFFDNTKPLTNHKVSPESEIFESRRLITKHVVLWQLPPSFKKDIERVKNFIKLLPSTFRHAFEFRHNTWTGNLAGKAVKSERLDTAAVLQDWKDWPTYDKPIGNFVYIRFHGKDKLYTSGYSEKVLANWAKKVREWKESGFDIYAYFNNDAMGWAPKNARTLKKKVGR